MNWTPDQLREYMTRRLASEHRAREKIANENNPAVGAVSNPKRKHDLAPALVHRLKRIKNSGKGLAYRVSIISVRNRLLDGDNLVAGCKWLRDQIAATLGRDDAEGAGIEFEYSQALTGGEEGTVVRIEALPDKHTGMAARV